MGKVLVHSLCSKAIALAHTIARVEEPHAALQEFADRFNNLWILGRLRYKTTAQHRRSFLVEAA